jgi:hypothetical protein
MIDHNSYLKLQVDKREINMSSCIFFNSNFPSSYAKSISRCYSNYLRTYDHLQSSRYHTTYTGMLDIYKEDMMYLQLYIRSLMFTTTTHRLGSIKDQQRSNRRTRNSNSCTHMTIGTTETTRPIASVKLDSPTCPVEGEATGRKFRFVSYFCCCLLVVFINRLN